MTTLTAKERRILFLWDRMHEAKRRYDAIATWREPIPPDVHRAYRQYCEAIAAHSMASDRYGIYGYAVAEKQRRPLVIQQQYFAQFGGDTLRHFTCDNCGAKFLAEEPGRDSDGRVICCAHCIFNPLGCRCQYGDYGVAQDFVPYDDPEGDYEDYRNSDAYQQDHPELFPELFEDDEDGDE